MVGICNVRSGVVLIKDSRMTTVREATRDDIAYIATAQVNLAQETEDFALDYPTVIKGVTFLFDHPERGTYYVAEHESVRCGVVLVMLEWSDWRAKEWSYLYSLYVDAPFRRHGVFRTMYNYVKEEALKKGHAGIRLYVDRSNERALSAYKGVGMTRSHYDFMEEEFHV
jgi:ribosomal protein S18 acetylase RimI-like enzyme